MKKIIFTEFPREYNFIKVISTKEKEYINKNFKLQKKLNEYWVENKQMSRK